VPGQPAIKAIADVAANSAIFAHPDKTDTVDCMDDPVTEIATKFHAMGPVIKGHGTGTPRGSQVRFGDIVLPNILLTAQACQGDVYAAITFNAVRTLYTRPKVFSSTCFLDSLGRQGPTLTTMDPPEHSKYRVVAQPGFTPSQIAKYDERLIRPSITRRFAELKATHKGQANLVRHLTPGITFEINGTIIGFTPEDVAFFTECKKMAFSHDPEAVAAGTKAMSAFSAALIEDRRANPKDDLISFIVQQQVDGEPVSHRNLLGLVNVIMSGGVDTIYKQSGNIVTLLLDNPDQFDLLRADRSLIPGFIEETIRYEAVPTHFPRMALEDTELEGVAVPAGAIVFGMIFSANRDPARWPNPHVLDAARPVKPNVAFSAGPHACIGAGVARLALACFVEHLIDDLPRLRWDPDQPRPKITGWTQRMPLDLPVVWDEL